MKPYFEDGQVTLYRGDCLELLPVLAPDSVDGIVTDPPFKLSQEYSQNTDPDNLLAVSSVWVAAQQTLRVAKPGAVCAVFYDTRILPVALRAFTHAGWKYLRALTLYRRWGQCSLVNGWMTSSDFVLIFAKPGKRPVFHAEPRHDVYLKDTPEPDDVDHPARKPLACVRHVVENVCPPGGLLLDPYAGSGTSLVAAKQSGRAAIGIELEERYCAATQARLEGKRRLGGHTQAPLPLDAA